MDPLAFYTNQISFHSAQFEKYKKKELLLSFFRLAAFITLAFVVVNSFIISALWGIPVLLISIVLFGLVLNYHLRINRLKLLHQYMVKINEIEINSFKGDYSAFPSGEEFFEKEHPYIHDLDIFGKHSVFQFINRTNTEPGASKLADWLKKPAPFADIKPRQEAVSELSAKPEWRQTLRSLFYVHPSSAQNPKTLLDWCFSGQLFNHSVIQKITLVVLSALSFTALGFWLTGASAFWLSLSLIINISVYYRHFKSINTVQSQLSKSFAMLESYSDIIQIIEKEPFTSVYLTNLQQKLSKKGKTSTLLKELSSLSKKLDYRLNPLVGIPLNLFVFWDIYICMQLENWKTKHSEGIMEWFNTMAEFEALSSLANMHFNHPGWVFPNVSDSYFRFEALEAGHPLIPEKNRITNSFSLNKNNITAIITGSNMSGKSTFLRTCGVNIVMAMAGAPVCAMKFEISHVTIYTSMRISDSLEENTSSFYAELKKLSQIIKVVEQKEKVFLLLDEILRGTNSNDRHTGSVALIKQLIKNSAPAIVATHDLSLSQLEEELPENIDIYNFDVKIDGEELFFDYKINPGICKSLNASLLMKKMGIEI